MLYVHPMLSLHVFNDVFAWNIIFHDFPRLNSSAIAFLLHTNLLIYQESRSKKKRSL